MNKYKLVLVTAGLSILALLSPQEALSIERKTNRASRTEAGSDRTINRRTDRLTDRKEERRDEARDPKSPLREKKTDNRLERRTDREGERKEERRDEARGDETPTQEGTDGRPQEPTQDVETTGERKEIFDENKAQRHGLYDENSTQRQALHQENALEREVIVTTYDADGNGKLNKEELANASDEIKLMVTENTGQWHDLYEENSSERRELFKENQGEREDWRDGQQEQPVEPATP